MALGNIASSNATPGTGNLSWTHTPTGDPRGVVVYVVQNAGTTDQVTDVTYGGVSMTEMTGSPNQHLSGENGTVYGYFLGASIPTGSQTVVVTVNNTNTKAATCWSVTAGADTEIVDVDATINSTSLANPSVTLSAGGREVFAALGFHSGSGANTNNTPLTNWSAPREYDFGAQTAGFYHYTILSTSDVTAGWTQAADDATMIAVAIGEIVPPKILAADGGSYTVTGTAAALERGREVAANGGSYAITGTAATLVKASPKILAANGGTYAITGAAASLELGREVVALPDSYTIAGTDASLRHGYRLRAYEGEIIETYGSYAISGTDATLVKASNKLLSAEGGVYVITGPAASLRHTYLLTAAASSYNLTDSPASLLHIKRLAPVSSSYVISGTDALFKRDRLLAANPASYSINGQPATLITFKGLSAEAATYVVSGNSAALLKTSLLSGLPGSYVINGVDASLFKAGDILPANNDYIIRRRRRRISR